MARFSTHAKYRYSNRFLNKGFKDENAYKKFAQDNQDWEKEITALMTDLFTNSDLIYTGKIGNMSDRDYNYYANVNSMITFIADIKGENIITCYKVFYDLSEKLDKEMAKSILKEIHSLESKKEKQHNKIKTSIEKIEFNMVSNDLEIERVKNILVNLEKKKEMFKVEKSVKSNEIQETDYQISKLATKLCYSVELMNDTK